MCVWVFADCQLGIRHVSVFLSLIPQESCADFHSELSRGSPQVLVSAASSPNLPCEWYELKWRILRNIRQTATAVSTPGLIHLVRTRAPNGSIFYLSSSSSLYLSSFHTLSHFLAHISRGVKSEFDPTASSISYSLSRKIAPFDPPVFAVSADRLVLNPWKWSITCK